MKSLASRNVDFETKRRRLEVLNSKDQLKGEDIEEYKLLTLWYNEFKSKLENVDEEYESFVKTEEKQRQIEQLAITEAKSTLGSILDTVREENELKAEELQLLSNILSAKNEDPNALTEEAKELIQDNQFYKQSRLKYLFKKGLLEQKALKIGFLKVRIKNTLNKAKHEDTLVDGMYFKIQNLNDDIKLRLRQIQNLMLTKNVMMTRVKRLETTIFTMKTEKKEVDTEGEKLALRKQEDDNKAMVKEMDEINESLKKFVNSDFGALVNNRITASKLSAENEQILKVISKIPKPVKQSTILKQSTEIGKKVFDMKDLLYHLVPELKAFVSSSTKPKETNPAIALLKKLSPLKLKKADTLDIMKDGHDEEEEDPGSEVSENKQMTRIQESDHIIKYFKGDTDKIQDLVIQEIKNETDRYFEGRFQVLSLFQLKIFASSEFRHFVDRLEELKAKDISPIENRLERENIATPEIYLIEDKEAMESENHFLMYRASSGLKFLQKLKYQIESIISKLRGLLKSILIISKGMHTSRRVNDLKNELEFVFSNNFTASDHLSDEITSQPRDTVAKILFFDWVLLDDSLFLTFGQHVELYNAFENLSNDKARSQNAPEKLLEETIDTNWKRFNTFVDINMRLLNKVFKEFLSLIERDRDNVQLAVSNLNADFSKQEDGEEQTEPTIKVDKTKARSGLIYHEFDYMEYFASKSSSGSEAEKEESWSRDSEALENEAKKAKKVKPVEVVQPVRTEFDKVKDLVVNMEEMKWSDEFLSSKSEQFHLLMKNINTSYTIFKNNIAQDKGLVAKQLEDKPANSKPLASHSLFKKLALKKQLSRNSKTNEYFRFGTQKTDVGLSNDRNLSPMRMNTFGSITDGPLPTIKLRPVEPVRQRQLGSKSLNTSLNLNTSEAVERTGKENKKKRRQEEVFRVRKRTDSSLERLNSSLSQIRKPRETHSLLLSIKHSTVLSRKL